MALNMNYSLLVEGANSKYTVPEYRRTYNMTTYTESYMMGLLTEFSNEMREAKRSLREILSINESGEVIVQEADVLVNIVNGVRAILDRVITAIKKLLGQIILAFQRLIAAIQNKFEDKAYKELNAKYKGYDFTKMLTNAINRASADEKTIAIADINPTADMLGNDFPNTSIIGGELTNSVRDALGTYCYNVMGPKNGNPSIGVDADAAEGLADYISKESGNILASIFGKYAFDPTNIIGSANDAAMKAFGDPDKKDTVITPDLYNLACDNLERGKEIIRSLEKEVDTVRKSYNAIINDLDKAKRTADTIYRREAGYDIRKTYQQAALKLVANINRIVNMVDLAVRADFSILMYKYRRANQIFSALPNGDAGDSARVKSACLRLIKKYEDQDTAHVSESSFSSKLLGGYNVVLESAPISGMEASLDAFQMNEDFDIAMKFIEEAWNEQEFSVIMESVIIEAEGEGGAGNAVSNMAQAAGDKAKNVVDTIVQKLVETFNKFKGRIAGEAFRAVYTPFWNKNSAKIKGADFSQTKVNQWYSYDFDNLKDNDFVIPFDVNNEAFKDDKATQQLILDKLKTTDTSVKEGESFSQIVSKRFYTKYTENQNGGVALGTIDKTDAIYNYVDDFTTKGFNGETLGSINKNFQDLDKNYKDSKRNMKTYVDNMKTNETEKKATGEETKAPSTEPANAGGQQTTGANSESAIMSDFKFNLAENFGLYNNQNFFHEAEINGAPDLSGQGEKDAASGKEKEVNAMLTRYFKFTSYAISAKMTSALAAYKQYMALYQTAFKGAKKPAADNNANAEKAAEEKPAEEKK